MFSGYPLITGILTITVLDVFAQQECAPDGTPGYELDPCNLITPCIAGYVVPDHEDCAKYYMCTNGIWVLKDCPPPMQYNKDTYTCCTNMDPSQCLEECIPTTGATDAPYALCDSTPVACIEGELAPDKNYCDRYWECLHGFWQPRQCPVGTAFDPVTLECIEDIEEANCAYRCLTTAVPPTTVPPTTIPPTTTVATTTLIILTTIVELISTENLEWNDTFTETEQTKEVFTEIYMSDPSEQSTVKLTRRSTRTTTPPRSSTTTHTPDATVPPPESFPNAILIGSACGAAAAVVIVVVAIMAQNGIIRCDCKKPPPQPVLPSGTIAPAYLVAYAEDVKGPDMRGRGLMLSHSVSMDRSVYSA